jgi:hypothetical protein
VGTQGREAAKVSLYDQSMAEAFGRFCRAIWPDAQDRGPSAESADHRQEEHAGARLDAPTFVFVKGDEIIGHVATIPVRLTVLAKTVAAHWIVGFMVRPEHRNGLVGPLLIKEVNRSLDCALSLFVEPPVLRILAGLKWVHKGVLPQYLRVLNARGVSRNLQLSAVKALASSAGDTAGAVSSGSVESMIRAAGGWALAIGQAIWVGLTIVCRPRTSLLEVREEQGFDDSYSMLWQAVSGQFGACLARDQKYLQGRFGRDSDRYRVFGCRRANRLLGYCIVKTRQFSSDQRMGNMKVGTIVDCLFDPAAPAVFQALLDSVIETCAREGVDAVLCTASHAAVRRLLRRSGFLAIPGNLNFAFHNRTDVPLQDIPLESWHIMRGDSDADQNF